MNDCNVVLACVCLSVRCLHTEVYVIVLKTRTKLVILFLYLHTRRCLFLNLNTVEDRHLLRLHRKREMEGGEARRAGERSGRLSALQEQLVWSLLSSGLSKELLIQAMGDLERERASASMERTDRADGESSEEGEMENPPPIFGELERLPPEEAVRQRAEVDQLLQ